MYNYLNLKDTILAQATASGMAAISVIRISGVDAIEIVAGVFSGKDLRKVASHTVHLGYIRDEAGKPIDQVLVTVFIGPNSYTREHVVEISCHGSPFIVQKLMELFLRKEKFRDVLPTHLLLKDFLRHNLCYQKVAFFRKSHGNG